MVWMDFTTKVGILIKGNGYSGKVQGSHKNTKALPSAVPRICRRKRKFTLQRFERYTPQ